MEIDGRTIGSDQSPYVIAEISANHGGDLKQAVELVHASKEAGADAIKLQHYTPDTLTVRSSHPDFEVKGGTLWDGRQLADLYAEAMTPWEWTDDLAAAAKEAGITWFSSPFDPTAVDFLAGYDVPAFKIASFEIIDLPLVRCAASHGRPLIISTGMANLAEIDAAVTAASEAGAGGVALLRCNSAYPARVEEMDLRAIPVMADVWRVPVGLSDHTIGSTAAITAVALGASVIEKHVTMSRAAGGPDSAFSVEPHELAEMITSVRDAHASLGRARFGPSTHEVASRALRRSLRVVAPIPAGQRFTRESVRSVRPAGGLAPDEIDRVIGSVAANDLAVGDPVTWDVVRPPDRGHSGAQ